MFNRIYVYFIVLYLFWLVLHKWSYDYCFYLCFCARRWLYNAPCQLRTWVTWKEHQSWLPIWRCFLLSSSSSPAWSAERSIQVRAHTCRHIIAHLFKSIKHGWRYVYCKRVVTCFNTPNFSRICIDRYGKKQLCHSCNLPSDLFLANVIPGNVCACFRQWLLIKQLNRI